MLILKREKEVYMKINSFYPVLMVSDVKECVDFFSKYFEFKTSFESDWYISLLDENNNELALLDYKHETVPQGFQSSIAGLLLNIEVDNVDEVYNLLRKDLSDKLVLDIQSEDFGQRHFIIEGPNKLLIDVIQEIEPSAEFRGNYE